MSTAPTDRETASIEDGRQLRTAYFIRDAMHEHGFRRGLRRHRHRKSKVWYTLERGPHGSVIIEYGHGKNGEATRCTARDIYAALPILRDLERLHKAAS